MAKNVRMLTNARMVHIHVTPMQHVPMPSKHILVNVMMDMKVMVIFVMKLINVQEEFTAVIQWQVV